jgi:hypothetical protein
MSTKKFKIVYGYNEGDYIAIDENELPRACALFREGIGRGFFNNGAVRGQDIMRIVPDWHADQGWNKGWKMQADDYEAIRHLERPYQETYEQAKFLAEYAIRENKRELLTQPFQEAIKLLPDTKSFIEKITQNATN